MLDVGSSMFDIRISDFDVSLVDNTSFRYKFDSMGNPIFLRSRLRELYKIVKQFYNLKKEA